MRSYGEGTWAPGQETPGMSASRLWVRSLSRPLRPAVLDASDAGQGAHREVGSEGFAAKRRAVAEVGEPVGQIQVIPSLHYGGEGSTWTTWAQQGVCGRHGVEGACVTPGGLVRSRPTGTGTWAYKPRGEVAGNAVREVGVASGTHEPGENRNPGTASMEGRRAVTQKAPTRGKGPRREMASRAGEQASRRSSGLMVAAAMTEALALRRPEDPDRGAG